MSFRRLVRTQWDRVTAAVLVVAGVVALLAGWIGVSGTVLAYRQIPYVVSGGLVGLTLIVLGVGAWLSADLHDEWRKLDRLEERLAELAGHETSVVDEPGRETSVTDEPVGHDPVPPRAAVGGGRG
jgi:hypothetical protein